jgi:hypothetical protein
MNRRRIKMLPVTPRQGVPTMVVDHDGPAFKDDGPVDYLCSGCGRVLGEAVEPGFASKILTPTPEGMVIQCRCGALSSFPNAGAARSN